MPKQEESKLTDLCLSYLETLEKEGVPIIREHRSGSGGFNYKKGIPDVYVIIGPIHIECELKTPSGQLSSMQEKYKYRFIKNGTPYINPRTFEEFKNFIDSFL